MFPNADKVGNLTVFDIEGNNVLLIAAIITVDRRFIFALS